LKLPGCGNNAINLISNKPYTPSGGELAKGDGKAKLQFDHFKDLQRWQGNIPDGL